VPIVSKRPNSAYSDLQPQRAMLARKKLGGTPTALRGRVREGRRHKERKAEKALHAEKQVNCPQQIATL